MNYHTIQEQYSSCFANLRILQDAFNSASSKLPATQTDTALILVDVWNNHAMGSWSKIAKEITRTEIASVLDLCRSRGNLIVHATYNTATYEYGLPMVAGDYVLPLGDEYYIKTLLAKRGIKKLIYVGYATNMCVMHRGLGILKMLEHGYDISIVKGATLAIYSFIETGEAKPYSDPATWPVFTRDDLEKFTNDTLADLETKGVKVVRMF
jgi:hypothetical protein